MPCIGSLVAYPVKSLDGTTLKRATVGTNGALRGDRTYAFVRAGVDPHEASVSGGGGYVNGKSEPALHRLRASYELAGPTDATPTAITLRRPERDGVPADERTFRLPADRDATAAWVGAYLGYDVDLVREPAGGLPDDRALPGPTVVSRATLETFASWFDEVADATEARRRLRPNLVVTDVPAFWEDHLVADHGSGVRFTVGAQGEDTVAKAVQGEDTAEEAAAAGDTRSAVSLLGVNPCQRCVVPARDPDTGTEVSGFRETFIRRRRETRPAWLESDRFDHDFRLMVNTVVPRESWGRSIAVGDPVRIEGSIDGDDALPPTEPARDGEDA
ncbi:MOSC domain-containing protein [Halorubrum vacuolatum]|uniref:MOSC domain-containing protein n=1 Tax=Halorubrum vacuolatum TaxID=63740 RepID=A0A238UMX7_HALVU|nr:MOSC N-terminal beta barrel domain-containing protein [Halorubrum vacuolatum]SNR23291.1 hypothetical protein SAMN06264855_10193 [Halorubrum vacuolatum]